ncbi:AMP-dependent synthetase/ligase [Flaviflexus equikiangi]|uniref:AMP-dependent synthetase/ligase n=1 Tax=Flaviflexus equikiangi TaxID=2758573 RepID=UPI001C715578|nr:AMP-binding protein [Flaviflexus equikiangi]
MTDHSFVAEASTPALVDMAHRRNVTDLLVDRVAIAPEHHAFRIEKQGALVDVTTQEFYDLVTATARGLIAHGVRAGDRLAIHGATGYPWAVADMASFWVGAIVIPVFDSSSPEQVRQMMIDAEVQWAFADSEAKRRTIIDSGLDTERQVTAWDLSDDGIAEVGEAGASIDSATVEERRLSAGLDDTATMVYTSGTEGSPKGVVITHRNLMGQVLNIGADYSEVVHDRGSTLIFLPLAHVLARGLQLICIAAGMTISYEPDPKQAIAALSDIRPTFLVVVPRILEKVRERLAARAEEKKMGWLWRDAERTGIAWGSHLERLQHEPDAAPPRMLSLKKRLYDKLFYSKVRALMGGNIEYLLCGAAPLNASINRLFRGMGLEVIEGYGLTETTAPLTGNRPGHNYAGTVGQPGPGHTVRISPEGEILASGIGVSPGYYRDHHNEGAFVDGFLKTGDLGHLDDEGRLTITGRIRDTVVTAGGKTIAPQGWQARVEENPLVAHAVVVGESRPYPAALIFLDPEEAAKQGISSPDEATETSQVTREDLIARILPSIRLANLSVSAPEQIKRFKVLLSDLNPGGDFVTPTMKLRRSRVIQALSNVIDDLYKNGSSV